MVDQHGTQRPSRRNDLEALQELAERSQCIVRDWLADQGFDADRTMGDLFDAAEMMVSLTSTVMAMPASLVTAQMSLWQDYFSRWQTSANRLLGPSGSPGHSALDANVRDAWQNVDIFSYLTESYVLATRCVHTMLHNSGTGSDAIVQAVDFHTRRFLAALSPASFAQANPEVIRATTESQGENLLAGLKNLLKGLEAAQIPADERRLPHEAFIVGKTVATTPGKVIFRNDVMELIQYAPRTAQVMHRPLLFVPAWTGKFYVFDLRVPNSLVRWAVEQGHTVFMISWVNPGASDARKTFEDYAVGGPLAALDAIEWATGAREVNAVGHCLGGTLLAASLAYLADAGDARISSGTFLATSLDFSAPKVSGSRESANSATERSTMGSSVGEFGESPHAQREQDLIWSFVLNNYLLGNDPFPSDLLFWNRDQPSLPLSVHRFCLDDLGRRNKLMQPGGVSVGGRPIDLRKVRAPTYFLSTREDHIAPWTSTYKAARIMGGPQRFTLAASGHISGVLNPPAPHRYCYWTAARPLDDPEAWRAAARAFEGSWWRDWETWIRELPSGNAQVSAREPGERDLPPLSDAPGLYVTGAA
ncbi:MAG: alpha/beta fold hydrolase [Rhodospirillales bacterium]|nr:alpha/beta fold hydrolase [Rhodospirillales bacterium]